MNLAGELLARADAGAPALWWRGEAWDRAALEDRAARAAGGLRRWGIEPGDRVGIVCGNEPRFVVSYLAVLRAGAVAVPVNPLAPATELAAELAGTGVRAVLVGRAGRRAVAEAVEAGDLGGVTVVDAGGEGPGGGDGAPPGWEDWEALLEADPAGTEERAPDDPAVLAHTSGTAGRPRAAVLTHGSLAANVEQALRHPTLRVESGDVVLGVLPLFHSYGLNAVLGVALASGVQVVLVERFEPRETLELVDRLGVTVVLGVPPMFAAWRDLPEAPAGAFSSVRVAVSGAAALLPEVQEGFRRRFGVALHQGYGLTEASPVVTTTGSELPPRPGSIGVPLPGVEVRVVDREGRDVLAGDPGEIWVRGGNVFAGYWEDEEATRRVLAPGGWLRTGDVAVADADGFLSIVDRTKDLVIVSGFNVYPAEVEDVLVRHESVQDAAVVGAPHPETGEAVQAYVVPAPDAVVDEASLVAFCGRFLARYKCPVSVQVVDHLPRGLAGKLRRRELPPPLVNM